MPSVDDLVISLRIDEGSNLAKLKKQLDALVGPEGKKEIGVGGTSLQLERTMGWIKDRMVYLTPEVIPGDPTGQKTMAASMIKQLRDFPAIGAGIVSRTGMPENYPKELERLLLTITEGNVTGRIAQNIIAWVKKAMDEAGRPGGEGWGKKVVEMIQKAGDEGQAVIAEAFRNVGFTIAEFVQAYKIKPEEIEKNQDKINEFLSSMLTGTEGAKEAYDTLTDLEEFKDIDWSNSLGALEKIADLSGVAYTRNLVKNMDYLKNSTDPNVIAMYVGYTEQILKNLTPLIESYYKVLSQGANLGLGFGGRRMKVSDITILGGPGETIKDLVQGMDPESLEKIKIINLELEKIGSLKELDQLIASAEQFGHAIMVGARIPPHIKRAIEEDPRLGFIEKTQYDLLETLGQLPDIGKAMEKVEELADDAKAGFKTLESNLIDGFAKMMVKEKLTNSQLTDLIEGILMDASEKAFEIEKKVAEQAPKPTE